MFPDFLKRPGERCQTEWLRSLLACYADSAFNANGAVLATWNREEFDGHHSVKLICQTIKPDIPLKRNQAEWDLLRAESDLPPIPYNPALRVYADESGKDDHAEWIALIVIKEAEANRIVHSVITAFNISLRKRKSQLRDIHISEHLKTEQERLLLVTQTIKELCATKTACFIVTRNPGETENDLYARGMREVLCQWQDVVGPAYIDTPYDRANDDRKNTDLCIRIHNALQSAGMDYRSDDIILGKSRDFPGLGIADAVAYLYRRRFKPEWRDLLKQLKDNGSYFVI